MTLIPDELARILIVDDEQVIQHFYIKALQSKPESETTSERSRLEEELFSDDLHHRKTPALKPKSHSFELTVCSNSTDAVEAVLRSKEQGCPFSVVFLDVRMPPGPDGVWAAEKIRQLDPDIEIVIATAFSDIHPEEIAHRVPPAHKLIYLQKPFHILEINHLASTLSAKWAMEKQLKSIQSNLEDHIVKQKNELAAAHKTLEHMQKLDALGVVAGGIAHDFNNILSCIMGHLNLGMLDAQDNSVLLKRLETINVACQKARDLAGRILLFSRMKDPDPIPVKPDIVLEEVVRLIKASIPNTISIETDIRKETGTLLADPTQLHQVFINLCTNAAHAMKTNGGTLSITLDTIDTFPNGGPMEGVIISVSDTGHGIDPETIEQIFDPYFTTKEAGEGTGLGLSVTHGIIKKHGGEIHVTSHPGKGTRFDVYLKRITRRPVRKGNP